MGGLAVLAIIVGYVALAVWLIVKTPRWWKLATLTALVLVPGADQLFIQFLVVPKVCSDAGFRLLEPVAPEGGLLAKLEPRYLRETRLAFVEREVNLARGAPWPRGMGWDGAIAAIEKQGAGPVLHLSLRDRKEVWDTRLEPTAKYVYEPEFNADPWRFWGQEIRTREIRIEDRQSGHVISRVRNHAVRSGWVLQLMAGLSDAGPPVFNYCLASDGTIREDLVLLTFK